MSGTELLRLAIAPAETDTDLEAMIHVRRLVTPEARPTVDNLRFNLPFVVREEHVVERQVPGAEVLQETVPDGHDFLIVGHGAKHEFSHRPGPQKSGCPQTALPMKS